MLCFQKEKMERETKKKAKEEKKKQAKSKKKMGDGSSDEEWDEELGIMKKKPNPVNSRSAVHREHGHVRRAQVQLEVGARIGPDRLGASLDVVAAAAVRVASG